jgi:hypothetical protein
MKVMILALVALTSTQAFAADCGSIQKEALRLTRGYFDLGEVTRTEVANAELAVLEAQKACGEVSLDQYCADATVAAEVAYLGTKEESRVGMKSLAEVTKAALVREAVRNSCN